MASRDSARTYKQADYRSDLNAIWCPGCGDYHVLLSFTRAFAALGLPPEEIVVVSGIGCSSRIPAYTNCYGFHGVHGRSLILNLPGSPTAASESLLAVIEILPHALDLLAGRTVHEQGEPRNI